MIQARVERICVCRGARAEARREIRGLGKGVGCPERKPVPSPLINSHLEFMTGRDSIALIRQELPDIHQTSVRVSRRINTSCERAGTCLIWKREPIVELRRFD